MISVSISLDFPSNFLTAKKQGRALNRGVSLGGSQMHSVVNYSNTFCGSSDHVTWRGPFRGGFRCFLIPQVDEERDLQIYRAGLTMSLRIGRFAVTLLSEN